MREHHDAAYRRREAFGPGGPGGPGGRGRHGRHRGPGGSGDPQAAEDCTAQVTAETVGAWLAGRLPDGWFTGAPEVIVDRDEITVVGQLTAPATAGADAPAVSEAEAGRITCFREETREQRMAVAREAEHRYGRKVAWGAAAGDTRQLFTTMSVPVMTRLRQPERQVLDTLVDAGVARSRSDALAWCVRLVGRNSDGWLGQLRDAMQGVEKVRGEGPQT